MSDSDDDGFDGYGTPLDPIEEEDVTKKKPINIGDQVAVDEKGRRRFHGAFTGGFSAGYYNTVGSKEGWAPTTFKSSRTDRFNKNNQNALDFMDDEDKGAFGIAPHILRPTEEFFSDNKERKRPRQAALEGPIPGDPVLNRIIEPAKDTVGVKILIKMGWRPGQGIGPKLSKEDRKRIRRKEKKKQAKLKEKEEKKAEEDLNKEITKINVDQDKESKERTYGCLLPPPEFVSTKSDSDSSDEENILPSNVLFAPDDAVSPLCNPKEDFFGLGYKGLDRNTLSTSEHVNLFDTQLNFKVQNRKLKIGGEAFGVGAFETADVDIYSREDMSQYDFALETQEERKFRLSKESLKKKKKKETEYLEGFVQSKLIVPSKKTFPAPFLPPNFKPFHNQKKKSRFEETNKNENIQINETSLPTSKKIERHNLSIQERSVLIGEDLPRSEKLKSFFSSVPVSVKVEKEVETEKTKEERIERLLKYTQVLQLKSSNSNKIPDNRFKPYMKNPEKQERYEKYLALTAAGFKDCLRDIQPENMIDWEREREKGEFERAKLLFNNTIVGQADSRFVSATSHDISYIVPEKEMKKERDPTTDPIVAAKMNLFGKLTHKVYEWHPDKLLCKRFNIPSPYPNSTLVGLLNPFARSSSTSQNQASTEGNNNNSIESNKNKTSVSAEKVKKSLFDNIDFSKPPPGLFPPGSVPQSSTSMLEFDNGDGNQRSKDPLPPGVNEIEEIKEKERPPLNLFKEIFADTSSSSSEDEEEPEVKIIDKKKVSESESKNILNEKNRKVSTEIDIKAKEKNVNIEKKEDDDKNKRIFFTKPAKKSTDTRPIGIFDNLNLDKINEREKSHLKRINDDEVRIEEQTKAKRVLLNKDEDEEEEEEEEIYGPVVRPVAPAKIQIPSIPIITISDKNESKLEWVEKEKATSSSSSKKRKKVKSSKDGKKKKHKSKSKHKQKKKSSKIKKKKDHKKKESESDGEFDSDSLHSDSSLDETPIPMRDSATNKAILNKLREIMGP